VSKTPFDMPCDDRSKARAKRGARLKRGPAVALLGVAALFGGAAAAHTRTTEETPVVDAEGAPIFSTAQQIQRGGISLAQAQAMAQSRYQGRVVRAVTLMQGDRVIHEIRILGDDGRVRTVLIDGQTGAFL
jgi:uncharacterized membrane protein YkoI